MRRAGRVEARWAGLVVGLVLLLAPPRPASAAADPLAGLQRWLDGTRTLEASFEQRLASGALGTGLVESGRLWLRRPGHMRWDYLDPERKVALIDGDQTGLYVAEDEQYVLGHLDAGSRLLPALLAGTEPLAGLFRSEVVTMPDDPAGDGTWLLRLQPVDAEEAFEAIILRLAPDSFAIVGAEVVDPAGNRMLYVFDDIRRNVDLPDDVFAFVPPAGTEIVGGN